MSKCSLHVINHCHAPPSNWMLSKYNPFQPTRSSHISPISQTPELSVSNATENYRTYAAKNELKKPIMGVPIKPRPPASDWHFIEQVASAPPRTFSHVSAPMATVAPSAAVTIPCFSALKAGVAAKPFTSKVVTAATPAAPRMAVKASLKDVGIAVATTAAAGLLAGSAMGMEVLMGAEDGSLVFIPGEFTVAAGEEIVFKNNAGFPHNVVFDEDSVPPGVDATAISMPEEELLEAPGETYKVKLTEKGTYSFYCTPHQGAGMVGKVTVQ